MKKGDRIYCWGGEGHYTGECYDIVADCWSSYYGLPNQRSHFGCVLINDDVCIQEQRTLLHNDDLFGGTVYTDKTPVVEEKYNLYTWENTQICALSYRP